MVKRVENVPVPVLEVAIRRFSKKRTEKYTLLKFKRRGGGFIYPIELRS